MEYQYQWPIQYQQPAKYSWKKFWKYWYRVQQTDIGQL